MGVRARLICLGVGAVIGLAAATQVVAWRYGYHPALGFGIPIGDEAKFYPPWDFLIWSKSWGQRPEHHVVMRMGVAVYALVIVESSCDPSAVSPVGARGLTQLMPGTARELGVSNAFDIEQNLRGGARYLAIQIGRFGDLRLALAAYNSGPGRVARLGRASNIAETQGYVRDAVDCSLALSADRGIRHRRQCRTSGR